MANSSLGFPKAVSSKMGVILLVFLVLLSGAGYYFYLHYQKTQKMLQNPTDAAKEDVTSVMKQVEKLILLPKDEDATLATVSDKNKLENQAFFANAENGDKVLIFTKSKKAYLYRPSIDKLIDVAPVNLGTTVQQQPVTIATATSPTPSTKPTGKPIVTPTITPTPTSTYKAVNVALYNGTKTAGLAASVQKKLQTSAPHVTVVAKANAASIYTESVVIDFTGKYNKEALQLANLVGGSIGVLPRSEVKPTADILILLGPQE